ncbi:hypothetical protein [Bordetella genomosp. 4]|uniref:Uncharacterized protein n=1 Tax=Bordetella genomosp. 4 TaxID=463044 RepID=A0A261TUN5_9BORD|nr:hypothetical protein [Bordetella genomosp. 4]OZI52872.1 hypothetical protein CAL20_19605 [Bordetella genomosp. 4]
MISEARRAAMTITATQQLEENRLPSYALARNNAALDDDNAMSALPAPAGIATVSQLIVILRSLMSWLQR